MIPDGVMCSRTLQVEAGRRAADQAFARKSKGESVRVHGADLLNGVDGVAPGERHGRHERVGSRAGNPVAGCGADAVSRQLDCLDGGMACSHPTLTTEGFASLK